MLQARAGIRLICKFNLPASLYDYFHAIACPPCMPISSFESLTDPRAPRFESELI